MAHECPTCGRDGFESDKAMRIHHAKAHGESIAGIEVECEYCGSTKTVDKDVARKNDIHFCDLDCKADYQRDVWSEEDHPAYEREKITCKRCGEAKLVKPHRANDQKFCSRECLSTHLSEEMSGSGNYFWRGGKEEVKCKQCGDSYPADPCDVEETTFCSRECQWEWRSENLTGSDSPNWKGGTEMLQCDNCGSPFEAIPSLAEDRKYCSRECASQDITRPSGSDHPLWSGGDEKYGTGWTEKKRREVRIRDQARCQHCGRTEPDHIEKYGTKHSVHHITPARQIDDPKERNAKGNLITLCAGECHKTWEQMAPLRPDTTNAVAD